MKKIIFFIATIFSISVFSQVDNRIVSSKTKVGLIAEVMTGNELRLKTNSGYKFKDRDAVYITEPDSSPKGKSINVTTKGYYYYDASKKVWIKVNALPYSPSDVSSDNNENNLNNSKK